MQNLVYLPMFYAVSISHVYPIGPNQSRGRKGPHPLKKAVHPRKDPPLNSHGRPALHRLVHLQIIVAHQTIRSALHPREGPPQASSRRTPSGTVQTLRQHWRRDASRSRCEPWKSMRRGRQRCFPCFPHACVHDDSSECLEGHLFIPQFFPTLTSYHTLAQT